MTDDAADRRPTRARDRRRSSIGCGPAPGRSPASSSASPGGFGLGQVPAPAQARRGRRRWSAASARPAARSTCTCATARRSTSPRRTGYPVNLGMACPKGWEALAPLAAPDRATTPLLRDSHGRLVPVDWPTALGHVHRAVQGDPGRARARVGGLPVDRPDPHRGDGAARRGRQVRHGHGARRRQHPPVHGDRRSSPTRRRSGSTRRPTPTPTSRSPT